MTSHWEKKMKTYFRRIDFDKDGSITKNDFKGMADRFIEAGQFDAARATDLRNTVMAVWEKYLSNVGGGDAITETVFVNAMREHIKDDKMKDILKGPLPLFFHAVDLNNDGMISREEYLQFFDILKLDTKMAGPAFDAIDTDHDGQLSVAEFTAAGSNFFFSQEPGNPHDIFWGELI